MSTALGIVLQLTGCVLTSLAYILQKKAHLLDTGSTSVYLRWPWLLGFAGLCAAVALNLWSYSMLPQVALASFGAATLVFNLIFSWLLLGEPLTRVDVCAALAISAGTITALSAVGASPSPSLSDLVARLRAPSAAAYLALALGGGAAAGAFVERAAAARGPAPGPLLLAVAPLLGGVAHSLVAFSAKGVAAALFGGGEAAALSGGVFWAFFFAAAASLTAQLRYLNLGLSVGDAVTIVPVFQSSVICATAVAGVCLSGDLVGEPAAQQAQFAAGLFVVVGGVASLRCKGRGAPGAKAASASGGQQADDADSEPLVELERK